MKRLLYLMVASAFLAAQVFTIDIKIMQLSIYRTILILLPICYLLIVEKNAYKFKLSISHKSNSYIKFYCLWFVYSLFTIIWVRDYYSWLRAVFFIGSGIISIIFLSKYIRSKKDFLKIFNCILIMIMIHSLIGWYELKTGNYKFVILSKFDPYNQMTWNIAKRTPVSIFGNPNDFATVMVLGFFIAYICAINSRSLIWKLLSYVTMISTAMLCISTNSRANIIGLLIGMIILLYFRKLKYRNVKIILILLVLSSIIFIFPNIFESFYSTISSKIYFNFQDTNGSDVVRLNLIKNGLTFLIGTLGFGTGAGNIEYWMVNKSIYYTGRVMNIHNWWMEILVSYGIVIFCLYIRVYIRMAIDLYSFTTKSKDKFINSVSLGLLCFMIAFIIGSISSSSNISTEWLWVMWGVIIAFINYSKIIEVTKNGLIQF